MCIYFWHVFIVYCVLLCCYFFLFYAAFVAIIKYTCIGPYIEEHKDRCQDATTTDMCVFCPAVSLSIYHNCCIKFV